MSFTEPDLMNVFDVKAEMAVRAEGNETSTHSNVITNKASRQSIDRTESSSVTSIQMQTGIVNVGGN